jgi:hypothetical protein
MSLLRTVKERCAEAKREERAIQFPRRSKNERKKPETRKVERAVGGKASKVEGAGRSVPKLVQKRKRKVRIKKNKQDVQ